MIATGAKDEKGALVILWELARGGAPKPAAKFRVQGESAYALSFSPDGKWLASGCGDHSFCLWDVVEAKNQYLSERQIHEKYDGKEYIKSASEPVRPAAVVFSPAKGGLFATVGEGMKSVKLWIWRDNRLEQKAELVDEHNGVVTAVAFSKDARLLAIGCSNGRVTLYARQEE
jgi:WD40 repeat protein